MKRITLATTALVILSACGDEGPPPPPPRAHFGVLVISEDVDGTPLARVPVTIDDKVVGFTGGDGKFVAKLLERPGTNVKLGVGDLDGYRWAEAAPVTETLKLNSSGQPVPMEYRVKGESRKKDYMVWLKVNCDSTMPADFCKDRPVKLDGTEVAKTNEFGYAHFVLHDVPGTAKRVMVDTPTVNPLTDTVMAVPEDPAFEISLDLDPQVYVIEETFTNALSKRRPERKATTSRPKAPAKPKPKPADKPAKKPDKKDPKNEVIDLF